MHALHKKAEATRFPKAKEMFRKLRDFFDVSGGFGPMPAYAGMPSGHVPLLPAPEKDDAKTAGLSMFVSSKIAPKGTPAREIIDWGSVDIVDPKGPQPAKAGTRYISLEDAQKEVSRILQDKKATHEYIAYEAAKLCSKDSEVNRYTLHLMLGAQAEDFTFMPGEKLDDLYASKPKRPLPPGMEDAEGAAGKPTVMGRMLSAIARLWRRITKKPEKDALNRPYHTHFYDPFRDEGDRGATVLNGEIKFRSALWRVKKCWRVATELYEKGDTPKAFYVLGRLIHLVADLRVPAHVHNDIHGPTLLLGKLDSLEEWATKTDYQHILRAPGRPNVRIWDSGPLHPPIADPTWGRDNIEMMLEGFVHHIALGTRNFRSVDAEGSYAGQMKTGKLSGEECFEQAMYLIPKAISDSAQLMANFLEYNRKKR